ncbi:MAG TPA: anti-sigma factor [Ktedonobacteraceae bacterium]
MQCPQCNAQLEDDTVFCGNCGKQMAPLKAQGATVTYKAGEGEDDFATVITTRQGSQPPTPQTPVRNNALQPDTHYRGDTPTLPSSPPPPARKNNTWRIAFIVVMVLLIIGIGTLGTIALLKNHTSTTNNSSVNTSLATNANGTVSFSDSQNGSGHSNVVTVSVRGLTAPPTGSQYTAWIVDSQSERTTGLGTLTQNKDGTYTTKLTNGQQNVLSLGNKVEVTLEQGSVTVPTGQVLLSATFPPKAFIHIKHLLVSFPNTPGKIGLLVGLQDQAQKLSSASQLLQSISVSQHSTAIQCAAQSIIDIAEGTPGSHYQSLANQCASQNIAEVGDGYGLLGTGGYIANGKAHASLAATQTDTTVSIRVHAGHVAICLENMRGWITTIDQDAQALLNNPNDTAKVQEIVTLANHAYNGFDANGDGSIDPVPGEGGAVTAYFHGQLMAALVLAPGS